MAQLFFFFVSLQRPLLVPDSLSSAEASYLFFRVLGNGERWKAWGEGKRKRAGNAVVPRVPSRSSSEFPLSFILLGSLCGEETTLLVCATKTVQRENPRRGTPIWNKHECLLEILNWTPVLWIMKEVLPPARVGPASSPGELMLCKWAQEACNRMW